MKILIDKEKHKTNNFINYLVENHYAKGEKYSLKIYIEDKYDKRLIDKRNVELQGNILVQHEEGFDIIKSDTIDDFNKFKEEISDLSPESELINKLNKDNFKKEFVNYKLDVFEDKKYLTLDFLFIKI